MNIISWNCRGLNSSETTTIPYLRWLVSKYRPSFLFVQETKCSLDSVKQIMVSTSPRSVCGIDAQGSRGGLAVFCWGPFDMDVVCLTSNYVFCKIMAMNGNEWHILFLYGEPRHERRLLLWEELFLLLQPFTSYVIIGDINQVGAYEEKIGGTPFIRGWEDFNSWIHSLDLQDIPFQGPRFTWSNNRESEDLVMERLDRAYASPTWLAEFPSTIVNNFPITSSDHAPIMLRSSPPSPSSFRPYQVEAWCLPFSAVRNIVQEALVLHIVGSPMYVLTRKLSIIRDRLKVWCLDRKLFWGVNWNTITSDLVSQSSHIDSIAQGVRVLGSRKNLMNEANIAYSYWQQRIKDNTIRFGDCHSALLFQRIKPRKWKNNLFMIRNMDGEWVDDPKAIADLVLDHFKDILQATPLPSPDDNTRCENIDQTLRQLNLPSLTNIEADLLVAPVSDLEIQEALFDINNSKSPGLDGFPASFFKFYWSSIGTTLIQAVKRFFETGYLLREWNQSLLILIPKQDPPEEVNHLRPISLCNVIYKCISKCMVKRMQPLLPKLIDDYQNAFIPGRKMDDSKLLSHETLHIINKQRSGTRYLAALKLDMNKAYDRVSWLFILKVLKAYGFPASWIHLINQCISTVSYRILINGAASKPFIPQCGLRQGDPLSPYLFLFCMDIFSRMTSLAVDLRRFQGIKLRRQGPMISHLFFADDSLFFFKATESACTALKSMIDRFCSISGQILNLHKSFIKFSPNTPISQSDPSHGFEALPRGVSRGFSGYPRF